MNKKTKQILSLLMSLIMVMSMFAGINVSSFAADDVLDYLTWEINNGEVTITNCFESISGDIVIPDTIEGCPVTIIDLYAFSGCGFKSIAIPASVKEIYSISFDACYNLEYIAVDENNVYYSSDEYGVLFNKDKTQLISYPGNNSRTEYIIPESVKMLGSEAFTYSSNLKELTIPAGLTDMGKYNFVNCKNIENFIVDKNNPNYTSDENGVLYNKDMSILMRYTSGSSRTEYTIPENVMGIWAGAFVGCKNLKCVTIPVGVVGITKHAFRECPGIEKLIILNPDCELLDNKFLIDEGITIYGYVGSTAQAYAETYNRKFVAIDNEVCYHINTETINIVEADCKNNGYTGDVYCNDCEEIIENGETVPATDHDYIENIIKEPTFTQPGLKNDVCENCGDATAEEEIPQLTIEDSEEKENTDTDISIIYPDGTFDGEIEVEVTPVEEGEAYKLISHKEGNYKVTMFDINVTVDGEKVQPNGTVLVKIPLPKGYNQNKCAVYYVSDDGTMEELTTYHYKDGYIYFETDHFSYYAILEEEAEITEEKSFFTMIKEFFEKIIDFFKQIFESLKNLFA